MTDINNKKKKSLGSLTWVLAIITIAGLAFIFWPREDNGLLLRKKRNAEESGSRTINLYIQWAQKADEGQMSNDHDFTASGLNKMAVALDTFSKRHAASPDEQIAEKLAVIRSCADSISMHPGNTDHSRILKSAFAAAKETMQYYQKSSFPELEDEVSVLDRDISKLDQNELLLEQAGVVIDLFKQSAAILRGMNPGPAGGAK